MMKLFLLPVVFIAATVNAACKGVSSVVTALGNTVSGTLTGGVTAATNFLSDDENSK